MFDDLKYDTIVVIGRCYLHLPSTEARRAESPLDLDLVDAVSGQPGEGAADAEAPYCVSDPWVRVDAVTYEEGSC